MIPGNKTNTFLPNFTSKINEISFMGELLKLKKFFKWSNKRLVKAIK